jgi:hypothetical protein
MVCGVSNGVSAVRRDEGRGGCNGGSFDPQAVYDGLRPSALRLAVPMVILSINGS